MITISKKMLGTIIGVGALVIILATVLITSAFMKGCNSDAANANNPTVENVTDADGNVIADGEDTSEEQNTSGNGSDESQGNSDNNQSNAGGDNNEGNAGGDNNGNDAGGDNSGNNGSGEGQDSNGNGSSGNNSQSGDNSGSSNTSTGVTAQFKAGNSWESEGKKFVQYELVVTNNSGSDVKSWNIKVPITNNLTVTQKWGCTTEVSGSNLVIKPEGYNAAISKGGNISGIGLIMSTTGAQAISTYVVEADGKSTTGNNVANNNSGNNSGSSSSGSSGSSGGSSGGSSSGSTNYTPATPPEAYGGLHVVGTKLVDAKGNEIQLKGPSTHGLQWFPQYVNKEGFKTFRDDWGANVIRLAMYAREGGYVGGNQAELKKLIDNGVKYATELGMYVIIDWHVLSYNPNETKTEAIAFFDEISKKYASNPNVIYEICNEPTGAQWASQIKPYAESVISTIRKHDNDALIIVGTNTWSQDVHEVVGNKINDHNVIYALHFYAATHKDDLRNRMKNALDAGVPIFVSECSICDASGNGGIDYNSANAWIKLMDEYKVSYIAWNISNKNESSALIKSGVSKLSGWTVDELSETGKWWRKIFRGEY